MISIKFRLSIAVSLATILAAVASSAAIEPLRVDVEWRFDGDLKGWTAGGNLADVSVRDAALCGRATDWDPILFGPVFEIDANATQSVEIKIKATESAQAELFWTETLEGRYGGFSQEKHDAFSVQGDGEFRVYRIYPFWHVAGKIIRLRFDPPNKGQFAIEWIRIVDRAAARVSQKTAWTFDSQNGWWLQDDATKLRVGDGRLKVHPAGSNSILMSPRLDIKADDYPFVHVRMATTAGTAGKILCVSDNKFGFEAASFPLRSDGEMHSYNIDVGALGKWRDQIILLGLQPTDVPTAKVEIESIEIANEVRGPIELEVAYFGRTDGINRTGQPSGVTCQIKNNGGTIAEHLTATIEVPQGVTILDTPTKSIDKLSLFQPKSTSWQICSSRTGPVEVSMRVAAKGTAPVESTAKIEFTSAPDVPPSHHVPEPQPVPSDFDVGAFYFPGWHDISRWQPIFDFPMRRPVLGWYDEANPQCADWQIKWAVEHGITFFMVDWYWSQGNRHLEHWLHDAYMKSKHRRYLKWAVMWANHNRPNTHSAEDWKQVTQYWIDHYFGMKEYYQIDGRPAVFIWSPSNIRRDVGGSSMASELYATSQKMAQNAGLKGIYFVAMSAHESKAACGRLKNEGYEAFTSYHGFQLAEQQIGSTRFSFEKVVETGPEVWHKADQRSDGLLYMPIVDTGWASQPWHRSKARVITGRTPEQFGQLCRKARDYARATGKRIITIGPVNEWGEGSYIEPYAEYGFQDLDQLRAAFCPPGDYPPNLIPSDVGLGPYDLEQPPKRTGWEFNIDGDKEGWGSNGQLTFKVAGGLLSGETVGGDPVLQTGGLEIEACLRNRVLIRMRSSANDMAQLFWGTTVFSQSETNSHRFRVIGDGQFHDYQIDLSTERAWRGLIRSLRFDPTVGPGVKFAIDYIRVMPKKRQAGKQ